MKKNTRNKEKELEAKAELGYIGLSEKIGNNKKWFIWSIVAAAAITIAVVVVLVVTNAI